MANYVVSDTNLTAVADAIRGKGGTSASLSFPNGFISAVNAIPTGKCIGTMLAEESLGTVSTSSTSSVNLNKVVTVNNVNFYEALLVVTSVDSIINGRHACSCVWLFLNADTNINTKSSTTTASAKHNIKISSDGVATSRSNTTAYGFFYDGSSLSNGVLTLPMYVRYNSTQTGTINGNYTTRVYGFKLYDLIGG